MNKIKIASSGIRKLTVAVIILFFALQSQAQRSFVFLDNCDSANEWNGLSQLTVSNTDQQEGAGCLQTTGGGGEQKFRRVFSTPVDLTSGGDIDITDAVLSFWFYVSDISFITTRGQIEISSSGKADENEWCWYFEPSAIKQGWNQYTFDLSNHMTYGGDANMTAINWFRIYFFTDESAPGAENVIYRLDDIRVTNKALVRVRNLSVKGNTPGAKITWEALSRTTGGQYEIEHSVNGSNYTSLAIVPEKDGNMPMTYEYIDARDLSGMNYYRLKYFTADETVVLGTGYVLLQGGGDNSKSIVGKVITGYQGWFNTPGDGSTNSWVHWSGSGTPRPNGMTFEVYPDISEYDDSSLAQTGFADFGDGRKAKLFSSYKEDVIDTHFKWMREYEIDGAAMQRFRTTDNTLRRHRDSVTVRAARAAEKYDRIMYVMYDTDAGNVQSFKDDWLHLVNDLKITNFSSYARQNGKPVVCIWGFGFDHRGNNPANSLEIINWLKEQGCYVAGGVPAGWRNHSGNSFSTYTEVYRAFDMISPWIVGSYSTMQGIDNNKDRLRLDMEECQRLGIDYQPVAYPGFAWSQWKTGPNDVPNQQPRRAGEFFWKQLYNIRTTGIPNLYLAMFDEYDEGTAFMKNATDWSEIPTNQYFLTAAADGYWLSSDFQLRAARAASRVMKGTEVLTSDLPVPHSLGPVYYRNSFEKRNATYSGGASSGVFNLDPCFLNAVRISQSGVAAGTIVANEENQQARNGLYIARIAGSAANPTASSYYHKFGEAKIEITEGMTLTFWKYAVNEKGLHTSLSLQFDDATYLHATNLADNDGIGVNPKNARGQVGAWTKHSIKIGQGAWVGKTITTLIIGYEGTGTGGFEAYFDDVLISDGSRETGMSEIKSDAVYFYPTLVQDGYITFNTMQAKDQGLLTVSFINMQGVVVQQESIRPHVVETLPLNLTSGLYIVSIAGSETNRMGKVIIKK